MRPYFCIDSAHVSLWLDVTPKPSRFGNQYQCGSLWFLQRKNSQPKSNKINDHKQITRKSAEKFKAKSFWSTFDFRYRCQIRICFIFLKIYLCVFGSVWLCVCHITPRINCSPQLNKMPTMYAIAQTHIVFPCVENCIIRRHELKVVCGITQTSRACERASELYIDVG